jgi:hypothetical protein
MLRTPVPETAVHKDRDAFVMEDEVRTSHCSGVSMTADFPRRSRREPHHLLPSPARDALAAKKFSERTLRVFVAAPANPRHDF